MRYAVLVLGLLAAAVVGLFGVVGDSVMDETRRKYEPILQLADASAAGLSAQDRANYNEARDDYYRSLVLPHVLLLGSALGVIASFFGLARRRFSAALQFIGAAIGPAVMLPRAVIFSGALVVPAVLALFIGPKRPRVPDHDEE